MSLAYTIASYIWIPRKRDVFGGTDMTYLPLVANAGFVFFTDTPELAPPVQIGQTHFQLVLPAWFPRQAFFTRIRGVYSSGPGLTELIVWIDPKGISYATGTPTGAEIGSDLTRQKQMLVLTGTTPAGVLTEIQPVPVLFDRDAGDKLVVEISSNSPIGSFGVCFEFLVPNTVEPVAVNQ